MELLPEERRVLTSLCAPQLLTLEPERRVPQTSRFETQWGLCPGDRRGCGELRNGPKGSHTGSHPRSQCRSSPLKSVRTLCEKDPLPKFKALVWGAGPVGMFSRAGAGGCHLPVLPLPCYSQQVPSLFYFFLKIFFLFLFFPSFSDRCNFLHTAPLACSSQWPSSSCSPSATL